MAEFICYYCSEKNALPQPKWKPNHFCLLLLLLLKRPSTSPGPNRHGPLLLRRRRPARQKRPAPPETRRHDGRLLGAPLPVPVPVSLSLSGLCPTQTLTPTVSSHRTAVAATVCPLAPPNTNTPAKTVPPKTIETPKRGPFCPFFHLPASAFQLPVCSLQLSPLRPTSAPLEVAENRRAHFDCQSKQAPPKERRLQSRAHWAESNRATLGRSLFLAAGSSLPLGRR